MNHSNQNMIRDCKNMNHDTKEVDEVHHRNSGRHPRATLSACADWIITNAANLQRTVSEVAELSVHSGTLQKGRVSVATSQCFQIQGNSQI